jgi:hypothetical protein
MNRHVSSLQSRITLIALGALLCTGIGVAVVVLPGLAQSLVENGAPSQAHATGSTGTSAPSPSTTVGAQVDLRGIIQRIAADGSSFVLGLADGSGQTVVMTAQTQFGGDDGASSTRLRVGVWVRVRGTRQADGTVSALLVRAEESA